MKRSKSRVIQRVMNTSSLETLSDDQLLAEVKRLASAERAATVALVRSLIEVDARRLYLREGCSSLFTYCTHILHLAEGAAYNRIETARAARRFPQLLEALASSSITLTTARLLAPLLTLPLTTVISSFETRITRRSVTSSCSLRRCTLRPS